MFVLSAASKMEKDPQTLQKLPELVWYHTDFMVGINFLKQYTKKTFQASSATMDTIFGDFLILHQITKRIKTEDLTKLRNFKAS